MDELVGGLIGLCMDGLTDAWMDGLSYVLMGLCIDGWTGGFMDALVGSCVNGFMYLWMLVWLD